MSLLDDVSKSLERAQRSYAAFSAAQMVFIKAVRRGDLVTADKARYEAIDHLDAYFDALAAAYMRLGSVID